MKLHRIRTRLTLASFDFTKQSNKVQQSNEVLQKKRALKGLECFQSATQNFYFSTWKPFSKVPNLDSSQRVLCQEHSQSCSQWPLLPGVCSYHSRDLREARIVVRLFEEEPGDLWIPKGTQSVQSTSNHWIRWLLQVAPIFFTRAPEHRVLKMELR